MISMSTKRDGTTVDFDAEKNCEQIGPTGLLVLGVGGAALPRRIP
jgi:hypothetical protein